jgi:DNA-3-methyladenine glycosylase II
VIDGLPRKLDKITLLEGVKWLSAKDPDLGKVISEYGPPPLWDRVPGFPSLLKIILEQQVSLASAQSTYDKLVTKLGTLTPGSFLTLDDAELRECGFSRQKTRYGRILANSILDGSLDFIGLESLPNGEVEEKLTSLTGIGKWTAGIYLLMILCRPDVWPRGDLALNKAMMEVKGLETVPNNDLAEEIAENWRPWRSVAARILWHHYLKGRG